MPAERMLAFVLATAALVVASPARAQTDTETTTNTTTTTTEGTPTAVETTTAHAVPAAVAPAEEDIPKLDERTAFMVGKGRLKLGLLAFEYGILQQLSVGSDPPAWAARAVVDVWVPNVHLKFQFLDRGPVALAVLGAVYYARLDSSQDVSGHLIDVPLSLFATVKVHPRIHLHGEAAYVFARLSGTGDISRAQFNASAPVRAGQLGLMAQFRLTRIFSLTATGRYQVYEADIPFEGTTNPDPYTNTSLMGQLVPAVKHPWEVIGGIAVLWKHFHLIAGVGYGYYFLPGLDIPNTSRTIVPDLSLSVVL